MLEVTGLTFAYPGARATPAVQDVTFRIAPAEIFGFLGPSGAGKTTTQKILIGLLSGYTGDVTALGRPIKAWGRDYFEHVGVCFEFPSHYRKLTARENLTFFARLYDRETRDPGALLAAVGLGDAADRRVGTFSKGMQIRLNLARALLHEPDLLFLDEPTAGLDPGLSRVMRDLIRAERDRGATIFLTTHDMQLADTLCDRVGFLVDGALAEVDAPASLRLRHGTRALRVTAEGADGLETHDFPLDGLGDNAAFQALLRETRIETMHSQEPSLEDVFIAVTGKSLT